ncbi:MAG: DnaB-like helicase N-terminal domain-containing protein, partial [Pseudomonadota bacterium]
MDPTQPTTDLPDNITVLPTGDQPSAAYRTQPQNEEAEQALLGAILVNNAVIDRVGEFLQAD